MTKIGRHGSAKLLYAAAVLCICVTPTRPTFADASTLCIYDLLLETHAMANRCGETLDNASEQRFNTLIATAKQSIIDNSPDSKQNLAGVKSRLDKMESAIKSRYIGRDLGFCKTSEYRDGLLMLKSLISEKNYSGIKKSLELRRNPEDGDCL